MSGKVDTRAMFGGMKKAKGRANSNYVRGGHYWANITLVKADANRTGDEFVAIEMQIVKVVDDYEGKGHRLNEEVTHMLMTRHDSFMGNIKSFISKVLDIPQADVDEDAAEAVVAADQPLANTVCEFRAREVMTKKNTPFTQIDYVREVPIDEVASECEDGVLDVAFPKGVLEALLAAD